MVNTTSNPVPQASKRLKRPQVKTLVSVPILAPLDAKSISFLHLEIQKCGCAYGNPGTISHRFYGLASSIEQRGEAISRTNTRAKTAEAGQGFT